MLIVTAASAHVAALLPTDAHIVLAHVLEALGPAVPRRITIAVGLCVRIPPVVPVHRVELVVDHLVSREREGATTGVLSEGEAVVVLDGRVAELLVQAIVAPCALQLLLPVVGVGDGGAIVAFPLAVPGLPLPGDVRAVVAGRLRCQVERRDVLFRVGDRLGAGSKAVGLRAITRRQVAGHVLVGEHRRAGPLEREGRAGLVAAVVVVHLVGLYGVGVAGVYLEVIGAVEALEREIHLPFVGTARLAAIVLVRAGGGAHETEEAVRVIGTGERVLVVRIGTGDDARRHATVDRRAGGHDTVVRSIEVRAASTVRGALEEPFGLERGHALPHALVAVLVELVVVNVTLPLVVVALVVGHAVGDLVTAGAVQVEVGIGTGLLILLLLGAAVEQPLVRIVAAAGVLARAPVAVHGVTALGPSYAHVQVVVGAVAEAPEVAVPRWLAPSFWIEVDVAVVVIVHLVHQGLLLLRGGVQCRIVIVGGVVEPAVAVQQVPVVLTMIGEVQGELIVALLGAVMVEVGTRPSTVFESDRVGIYVEVVRAVGIEVVSAVRGALVGVAVTEREAAGHAGVVDHPARGLVDGDEGLGLVAAEVVVLVMLDDVGVPCLEAEVRVGRVPALVGELGVPLVRPADLALVDLVSARTGAGHAGEFRVEGADDHIARVRVGA